MPTAAMSDGLRSAFASAPAVTSRVLFQISVALCSTHPARGKICSCSFWSTFTTRPSRLKIMHRVDVVPWSTAAMYCSLIWFSWLGSWGRGRSLRGGRGLDGVDQGRRADRLEQQGGDDRADDRGDHRYPGVAPVRRSLPLDREDRVRDAWAEVTGGVDRVAGRPAERVADTDHQQGHEQRADLGRGAAADEDQEDQHEGADGLGDDVPRRVADRRRGREDGELGARVLLGVEVVAERE